MDAIATGREQLAAVLSHLGATTADAERVEAFLRAVRPHLPRAWSSDRSADDVAALLAGWYRFWVAADPGQVNVAVLDPAEEGWARPLTVVRALVRDRPFVVDTLRELFAEAGWPIRALVHPVLSVERDAAGRPVRVGPPVAPPKEALVHAELGRPSSPVEREALAATVRQRLEDVVRVTDDFGAMLAALATVRDRLRGAAARWPERRGEIDEILAFLDWLEAGNFVFLGYRGYVIETDPQRGPVLRVEPGSGLGLLRDETASRHAAGTPIGELPEAVRRHVEGGPWLVVSKANAVSPVHRRARMDYIGIKRWDEAGRVVGEDRFLGLFTEQANAQPPEGIPILRRALRYVLDRSGAPPGGHDYKEIVSIFHGMAKEDLFQASPQELAEEIERTLALAFRDEVRAWWRPNPLGRGVHVTVILPRGKFGVATKDRIRRWLEQALGGKVLHEHVVLGGGDQARLYFHLDVPPSRMPAPEALEAEVAALVRTWDEELRDALVRRFGEVEGERLAARYLPALSAEYRAFVPATAAVDDIALLERMTAAGEELAFELRPSWRGEDATVLQMAVRARRLALADVAPVLENAGLRVVEVNPSPVGGEAVPATHLLTFFVQDSTGRPVPLDRGPVLAEGLVAVLRGEATDDSYNALLTVAGLRWRDIDVLRAYGRYAFQAGLVPTRVAPARALARYPEVARALAELFAARFDPERAADPATAERARAALAAALDAVGSLADDRALRRLCQLVEATVRTNYYRAGGPAPEVRSGGVPYLSMKLRLADIDELRRSGLLYEVYVHSARMEGVHLRAAKVARGGIRWSDRPDDFRTEVLGLVLTQVVKNALIVPSGAKGGFVLRREVDDAAARRSEADTQYGTLIRGLLDLTDNIVDGRVVPPPRVVRYDDDDPYLVVAADKGTAHLSDTANAIAAEYGFWLGDAFASGGSHGYDHKKIGITARGAWVCVERHFRELGVDPDRDPITVVGIGDMSGDVFGNGMLRSRNLRLIAAFDHRHIFVDPDPDPERSYAERQRLFQLPGSSWADYDRAVLSPGGFVVPRGAKEVRLTPPARRALGLPDDVEALDGEGLIRAILRAPVDLLWNGGIGTYVKDAAESHADVGDPSNDAVRVDAQQLRCRVVGEGGNLGFTQRARVAFARLGGKINTDALDNSGGVDLSDHEVNLKILLDAAVRDGVLDIEARHRLLAAMTDEVSALVLADNRSQSRAVSLDERRSRRRWEPFAWLIERLEREQGWNREAYALPSDAELAARAAAGEGLARPELCVLLAGAKLRAKAALRTSSVPDDPALTRLLLGYFPTRAVTAAGEERALTHPLRREIVLTQLVNELVDTMGAAFLAAAERDWGASAAEVARAWFVAAEIAGTRDLVHDLEAWETHAPLEEVYRWHLTVADTLAEATRWCWRQLTDGGPLAERLDEWRTALGELRARFPELIPPGLRDAYEVRAAELVRLGVDSLLAQRLLTFEALPQLLEILGIARRRDAPPAAVAHAFYTAAEMLGVGTLRALIDRAASPDPWAQRHAELLRMRLAEIHDATTQRVLTADAEALRAGLAAAEEWRREIESLERPSLDALAVLLHRLETAVTGLASSTAPTFS